jgi:signal transduction histidine kinase
MSEPGMSVRPWQRRLLPGGMVDAHSTRRSARDWVVDVTMLLLAAGIGALALADTWDDHSEAMVVVDVAIGVVACISLWWRRSHPVAVGVGTTLAAVVSAAGGGAGVIALFNAAIRAPRRIVGLFLVAGLALALVFPLVYPGESSYETSALLGVLLTFVVVGWGLFVRVRRELVHSLHERADRLETEQRLHVEQARTAERARIAREMHDVLAHRLSLLSLHAGALEFRPDASPEEIAEAAGVIRASSHAALRELRDVIGVLREQETEAADEPPQPTLADLPALVEESRAAGMRVDCRVEVEDELPPALGRTVYRVVQEGLTNARKHAPNAAVSVVVGGGGGERLGVEVTSRRAVGVAAGPEVPGAGTGLIGLAERVELAGGELRHGPGPDGDFVLRAELPWSA